MKLLCKPVTALAVFKWEDDIPVPYKFQYTNQQGKEIVVKVEKILTREKITNIPGPHYILYDCQSKIQGVDKRYTLKYFIDKCQWQLYKF